MRRVVASLLTAALLATTASAADRQPQSLRDGDGAPDLEGAWSNATLTPMQRPAAMGERKVFTPAEIAKIEGDEAAARAEGNRPIDPTVTRIEGANYKLPGIDGAAYDLAFIDPGWRVMRVGGEPRNSLITTPNGRPPAARAGAPLATQGRGESIFSDYPGKNDNPENRSLGERCIIGFGRTAGPPMLPGLYNNTYQIVQGRESVAILVEMVHDTRIVRLNSSHRTDGLRPWMGDAIGRYEGQTLVVETTNIPRLQAFQGAWEQLKVTERFTRVGRDRLRYAFQVEDPSVWDSAWGGEYEFSTAEGRVYEYACHEGNYGLMNIMAGARTDDGTLAQREGGKR
jgi:hypothetical protein